MALAWALIGVELFVGVCLSVAGVPFAVMTEAPWSSKENTKLSELISNDPWRSSTNRDRLLAPMAPRV